MSLVGFVALVWQAATAQVTLPNGFTENPQCVVKADHWELIPGTSSYRLKYDIQTGHDFSHSAHTILVWYYGGAEAMRGISGWTASRLRGCYQDYKVDGCEQAVSADKKIYRALDNFSKGTASNSDRKRLDKLFSQKPPAGLIRFAAEELGACFGDDPAQPSMQAIEWVEVTPDETACAEYGNHRYKQFKDVSDLRVERNLDAWWASFKAQMKAGQACGRPVWLPRQVVDNYAAATGEARSFANRPVEERIAGLNGCQIAYSLAYIGVLGDGGISSPPDDAIDWMLDYETSVIDSEPCPVMSQALSTWIQAQPLTKFEPAPDIFAAFRDAGPGRKSLSGWSEHISKVVEWYETPESPQYPVPAEVCSDYVSFLQFEKVAHAGAGDLVNYLIRRAQTLGNAERPALCAATPHFLFREYADKRAVTAVRIAEFERKAEERKAALKRLEDALAYAQKWKPDYRPPLGEPRCYRTGETTETCFYN